MQTNNFGEQLLTIRKQQNLSVRELAELSNLSTNYISKLEHGQRLPSVETLIRLSNALQINSDILVQALTKDYQQALKENNNG